MRQTIKAYMISPWAISGGILKALVTLVWKEVHQERSFRRPPFHLPLFGRALPRHIFKQNPVKEKST